MTDERSFSTGGSLAQMASQAVARPRIWCFLRAGSPRAPEWIEVFGSLRAPLRSASAVRARTPAGEDDYYLVDVAALSVEQRGRACSFLGRAFGIPAPEVAQALDEEGLPLLAADVTVVVDLTEEGT